MDKKACKIATATTFVASNTHSPRAVFRAINIRSMAHNNSNCSFRTWTLSSRICCRSIWCQISSHSNSNKIRWWHSTIWTKDRTIWTTKVNHSCLTKVLNNISNSRRNSSNSRCICRIRPISFNQCNSNTVWIHKTKCKCRASRIWRRSSRARIISRISSMASWTTQELSTAHKLLDQAHSSTPYSKSINC